ncbi:outer membrane beta-barrel protein [Myroides sp. LJL119]
MRRMISYRIKPNNATCNTVVRKSHIKPFFWGLLCLGCFFISPLKVRAITPVKVPGNSDKVIKDLAFLPKQALRDPLVSTNDFVLDKTALSNNFNKELSDLEEDLVIPRSFFYSLSQVEFYLAGGVNLTQGTVADFKGKGGMNFTFGANYKYEIDQRWSVLSGLEFSLAHSKVKGSNIKGNKDYIDIESEEFNFRFLASSFQETWKTTHLSIPLLVGYQFLDNNTLYVRTGVKFGIGLSNKVDLQAKQVKTSGYFPEYNVEFFEPEYLGFGNFQNLSQTKKGDANFRFSYVLEVGTELDLFYDNSLKASLFMDLGLTNQGFKHKDDSQVIGYKGIVNEALDLNSSYQSSSKKLKTTSLGIKLIYSFNL